MAGLFADIDHADAHRWKRSAGFKRLHDRFAVLHAFVDLANRARDHHVAGGLTRNVKRLQDWNTAGDECAKRPRKSRDRGFPNDIAKERKPKFNPVDDRLSL